MAPTLTLDSLLRDVVPAALLVVWVALVVEADEAEDVSAEVAHPRLQIPTVRDLFQGLGRGRQLRQPEEQDTARDRRRPLVAGRGARRRREAAEAGEGTTMSMTADAAQVAIALKATVDIVVVEVAPGTEEATAEDDVRNGVFETDYPDIGCGADVRRLTRKGTAMLASPDLEKVGRPVAWRAAVLRWDEEPIRNCLGRPGHVP